MSAETLPAELAEMRDALWTIDGSIRLPYVFGKGLCVQVYKKSRKVGPVIIPTDEQTVGDVLKMLGDLAAGERP